MHKNITIMRFKNNLKGEIRRINQFENIHHCHLKKKSYMGDLHALVSSKCLKLNT
jgi:hypothetical protein